MFKRILFTVSFGLSLILLGMSVAQAQWGWRENGRVVFSDQPPPQSITDKDIIRRPPGARTAASTSPAAGSSSNAATTTTAATSVASTTSTGTATAPKISGKDPELEKRKKEAEAKEAAAKKAEAEKQAAANKDNCERAKRSKSTFDAGTRIATTNAKGEREIMSDTARAAETQRLQEIIASSCS